MPSVARHGDPTSCGATLISGAARTRSEGQLVVRLGDAGTHGGAVSSGAARHFTEGSNTARVGDTYSCPIHGPNPIVGGSPKYKVGG